jgi:drug/metabolite transporter (DMT)-like permease
VIDGTRPDHDPVVIDSRVGAVGLLVLVCLVWGIHWAVVKIGLGYLPPLTYAALRVATGLLVVVGVLAWRGRLRRPDPANVPVVLSVGLGQIAAGIVIMHLALEVVPVGRSSVLVYTMPLWVAVLLAIGFGVRPRWNETLGLVLGLAGLAALASAAVTAWDQPGELAGSMALLADAVIWAAVTIHIRRHTWTQSPLELQPWQLLVALVPISLSAILLESGAAIRWEPVAILALLYSGPIATAFAYWASQSVTRALGAQASGTGFLAVPVVGLISGWLVFGETLDGVDLLGFLLVLGGVAFAALIPGYDERPADPAPGTA